MATRPIGIGGGSLSEGLVALAGAELFLVDLEHICIVELAHAALAHVHAFASVVGHYYY